MMDLIRGIQYVLSKMRKYIMVKVESKQTKMGERFINLAEIRDNMQYTSLV